MKIQESAENYLETILVLKKKNGVVRSIDIANDLGVSKPSVSVAMKNLRNGEYIEMDKEGYITLLDKGREIAEKIYERHTFLTDWLTSIGVDPTVAAEDACRIEHVISAECRSKRCQFLADSLSQRRSAHDAIGNIRTDLHPQFHQVLQCAPKIKQTVHSF